MFREFIATLVILSVAGCGAVIAPDTGYRPSARADAAPYPQLLDRDRVTALALDAGTPRATVDATSEALAARVARLRARARELSAPVLPAADRDRLTASARRALARL